LVVTAAPLLALFRADVEACGGRIEQHLGALEDGPAQRLDAVAREARVIAAAARILGIEPAFRLARALARAAAGCAGSEAAIDPDLVEGMFGATTVLARIAAASAHLDGWMAKYREIVDEAEAALAGVAGGAEPERPVLGSAAPAPGDLGPLRALLRVEVEGHGAVLADGLLALDREPSSAAPLDALLRAAHSIKGAAHAAHDDAVVRIAHELEACVVAARDHRVVLDGGAIDVMFRGVDRLRELAGLPDAALPAWREAHHGALDDELAALAALHAPRAVPPALAGLPARAAPDAAATAGEGERVIRIGADHLDRIMALAGEAVVESGWLDPFAGALATLKRRQLELAELIDRLRALVDGAAPPFGGAAGRGRAPTGDGAAPPFGGAAGRGRAPTGDGTAPPFGGAAGRGRAPTGDDGGGSRDRLGELVREARGKMRECLDTLSDRMAEFGTFSHQSASLSGSLYEEVIGSRMRPFADGLTELPRLVRDLSRQLGKQVRLEITGGTTPVDRDVLDKLAAPLVHLVRNALDHGFEPPDERLAAGKPAAGTLRIEARHRAGRLAITVADDGRGLDLGAIRRRAATRGPTPAAQGVELSEAELTGLLFQPGFSMAAAVTDLSGRGVGLDIVRAVVVQLGGQVRAEPQAGRGMTFRLELPVTRSVLRALLVEIGGEAFAFPLVRVDRVLQIAAARVSSLEGLQYFDLDGHNVGLIAAHQVLELPGGEPRDELCVVVVSDRGDRYGLSVDRFLGERDLVVQPFDPRLGKITDLAAASIMQDGTPVIILNVDDLVRSVDGLQARTRLRQVVAPREAPRRQRVLVVDASTTVREAVRRALDHHGYAVDTAGDGLEGWTALRAGDYALVVADLDLPRLSGHDLIARIRGDRRLADTPVVIVSNRVGLAAGADRYVEKARSHDDQLITAVAELIGAPAR
jgi:two-component system, chemotaxis family, sensor histidine kinase and response regulator WspE